MASPDLSLVDKAMKAGNCRLAHELLDLAYSDTATPATARNARVGGNGQRPPLAMIAAVAAIALLFLSPFLLSSPSDSSSSTQSEVTRDAE